MLKKILVPTGLALYSLAAQANTLNSYDAEPYCKAVDPRVDDAWCEADCMCDWCPGCGNDYCAGFCEWYDPDATTPAPTTTQSTTVDPNAPTTTRATHAPVTIPDNNLCDSPFLRNVIYLDYKIDWSNLSNDIRACIDACFNVLMLSFYIGTNNPPGPADALITWQGMSQSERQSIRDYAHSKNAVIMMSLGGATDHIEPLVSTRKGAEYARPACQFCEDYDLDGVDFDIELTPGNNGPFQDGTMQSFIYDGSSECRRILSPGKLIAHAPQGPYLGDWAGSNFGYTQVMSNYPDLIDFVCIQFYNQGAQYYTNYQNLFVKGEGFTSNSAIYEIADHGVDLNKLVVGKPVGPAGYASNGYVDPKELHKMGCQARDERGWIGGWMNWMYSKGSSDYVYFGTSVSEQC